MAYSSGENNKQFSKSMRDLNVAFNSSIRNTVSKNPSHSLLPLVKDYLFHSRVLLEQCKRDGSKAELVNGINSPLKSFKSLGEFFDDFEKTYIERKPSDEMSPIMVKSSQERMAGLAPKPSNAAPFSGFSFFTPPAPSTSISMTSSPTNPPAPAFDLKNNKNEAEGDGDGEDDEPPKVEITPVTEDDAVYSIRCKVFGVVDGKCKDKGIGMLYVKKLEDGKHQIVVRADNNLGTVILNILLQKSLPLEKNGKNSIMTVDLQANDKKGMPIFIKVKTENDATELLEMLKALQQTS